MVQNERPGSPDRPGRLLVDQVEVGAEATPQIVGAEATGPEMMTARLQRFGLARDQLRSALASRAGISPADLDALEHLEAAGPLTQRQLGDRLALTSGAITMLVDRLERGGWVRRRRHPTDRRSVLVELSAQAAERNPVARLPRADHPDRGRRSGGAPRGHRQLPG